MSGDCCFAFAVPDRLVESLHTNLRH